MMTIDDLRASQRAVITVKDAATLLGCDPRTVTAALSIHGGPIRAVRIGRRVVIPAAPLLAYIEGEPASDQGSQTVETPTFDAAGVVRAKLIELLGALEGVH